MQNFYRLQDQKVYIGAGNLEQKIQPGSYAMKYDRNSGEAYIEQVAVASIDKTTETSQMKEVLGIVTTFASSVTTGKFVKHTYKSKFGILLEGPPGTGKSQLVNCAVDAFIAKGGIVVFVADQSCYHSGLVGQYLKKLNTIDPRLPIMVVLEDLDSVHPSMEVYLTSILDGEQSPFNTFFLGTTNYLETISKRILRPGRFDLIYKVDGLSDKLRIAYIDEKVKEFSLTISDLEIKEMYVLTKGYNFSEIRTFMAYVCFFGFESKNLASKIARLDVKNIEEALDEEVEEYFDSPEDFAESQEP